MSVSNQPNLPHIPPDYDEALDQAIQKFRDQHKLPEDDAILLLVELFRIHQQHWDGLRRRELPAIEPLRLDVARFWEIIQKFQQEMAPLLEFIKQQSQAEPERKISVPTAILATLTAMLGGYFIGRVCS
jgi:hypothetical protein